MILEKSDKMTVSCFLPKSQWTKGIGSVLVLVRVASLS